MTELVIIAPVPGWLAALATPPQPAVPAITATHVLALLGLAIAALAAYLAMCKVWPYAACTRCKGSGKSFAPSGKSWRDCPRCKNTGKRVRIGRQFLDRRKENK